MRCALPSLVLLVFCLFRSPAAAESSMIEQGGVTIEVPAPEGFERLEEKTPEFSGVKKEMNRVGNTLLAMYLREGRTGVAGDYDRQFDIQTSKETPFKQVRKTDLARLREEMLKNREKIVKESAAQFGLTGVTMETVDDSSDRHFSYLFTRPEDDGTRSCAHCTTALIRGKVWLLYTRTLKADDPKEVAWCKTAGKAWLTAILEASPSDAATLAKEEETEMGGMLTKAATWAVVGGLIGLLVTAVRRKQKAKEAA